MENLKFLLLREHVGHRLTVAIYGEVECSVECEDCNVVLYSEEGVEYE